MNTVLPVFPEKLIISSDFSLELDIAIENEEDIENYAFSQFACSDIQASKAEIHHCTFSAGKLTNCTMTQFYFADIIFDQCDLAGTALSDSTFHRVIFKNCRLTGADFNDSIFEDCIFSNCQCEMGNFSGGKIRFTQFDTCQLARSSFESCQFKNISFKNCNLRSAELLHTRLKGIDLTSNAIEGIRISGKQELNGAIVSPAQAVDLAKLLGLTIQ